MMPSPPHPVRRPFKTHAGTRFAGHVMGTAVATLSIITVTGCAFVASAPPLPPETPRIPVNVMPPNGHGR